MLEGVCWSCIVFGVVLSDNDFSYWVGFVVLTKCCLLRLKVVLAD